MMILTSFWSSLLIARMLDERMEEFICEPAPSINTLFIEGASISEVLLRILEVTCLAVSTSLLKAIERSLIFLRMSSKD